MDTIYVSNEIQPHNDPVLLLYEVCIAIQQRLSHSLSSLLVEGERAPSTAALSPPAATTARIRGSVDYVIPPAGRFRCCPRLAHRRKQISLLCSVLLYSALLCSGSVGGSLALGRYAYERMEKVGFIGVFIKKRCCLLDFKEQSVPRTIDAFGERPDLLVASRPVSTAGRYLRLVHSISRSRHFFYSLGAGY